MQQKKRRQPSTVTPKPALGLNLHCYSSSLPRCCRGCSLRRVPLLCHVSCRVANVSAEFSNAKKITKYAVIHESLDAVIMRCNVCYWLCHHCLFISIEWYFAACDALRSSFIQLYEVLWICTSNDLLVHSLLNGTSKWKNACL